MQKSYVRIFSHRQMQMNPEVSVLSCLFRLYFEFSIFSEFWISGIRFALKSWKHKKSWCTCKSLQMTDQLHIWYFSFSVCLKKTQLGHKSCLLWTVDFLFRLPVGPDDVNTIDKETNGSALGTLTALQSLLISLPLASVHRAPESGLSAELCVVYPAGRFSSWCGDCRDILTASMNISTLSR